MTLDIAPIDLTDEAALGEVADVERAASLADRPDMPRGSRRRIMARLATGSPGDRQVLHVARRDGRTVGFAALGLPQRENLTGASLTLFVHPEARRRGIGRALLAHAMEIARAEGRETMLAGTDEPVPDGAAIDGAGSAFAKACGFTRALPAICRALRLADVPFDEIERLTEGHTAGYTAVSWSGPTPEEWVDDVAHLDARLLLDAPTGDLDWEAPEPDPATIREYERIYREKGSTLFHAAMRHDASGRLVAWTMIEQLDDPSMGFQQITIVDPEHRGHRLGLRVKLENHRQVRGAAPELATVWAWNATENANMIAINEAFGFRVLAAHVDWQIRL